MAHGSSGEKQMAGLDRRESYIHSRGTAENRIVQPEITGRGVQQTDRHIAAYYLIHCAYEVIIHNM